MICVNNSLLIWYNIHIDLVRYFIYYIFIHCTTSGRSLKQEGVYVTSFSYEHILLTFSLRTLACKWSSYSTWLLFRLWIIMMMLMDYDLMLFVICVLAYVVDEFSLTLQDIDRVWMSMSSINLLGICIELGSELSWFEYFIYAYVTYDRLYYDVVYGSLIVFC